MGAVGLWPLYNLCSYSWQAVLLSTQLEGWRAVLHLGLLTQSPVHSMLSQDFVKGNSTLSMWDSWD